jgi:hypothetical protein
VVLRKRLVFVRSSSVGGGGGVVAGGGAVDVAAVVVWISRACSLRWTKA